VNSASTSVCLLAGALLLVVPLTRGAQTDSQAGSLDAGDVLSGGDDTVSDISPKAFGYPTPGLADSNRSAFFVGHSFFINNWVAAPGPPADRSGLGPLFNARSCSACHVNDGEGHPPRLGQAMVAMLMRVSVPGAGAHHGPRPDPTYGGQIEGQALPGVRPEADVYVSYKKIAGRFADGEEFSLLKPDYSVTNLGYGPLGKGAMLSPRLAPGLVGLGLLEAVPASELRAIAEQQKRHGDGIHGRLNYVWDIAAGKVAPGRFGWKDEQPSVAQQTAMAFNDDMGLTTAMAPRENYTTREAAICKKEPLDDQPEVHPEIFQDIVLYARTLAVPARRDATNAIVLRGQRLFGQIGCADCHVPTLHTGDSDIPQLSHQTIHPYTDLLLHDMGEGLSDHRPVFDARGRDWRTPPLWGIGLVSTVDGQPYYLHDGRAQTLTQAILWHGGEAKKSGENFRHLSKSERDALIAFLNSL
jgi:CxxC motif-containing protein (DUF1111 family)